MIKIFRNRVTFSGTLYTIKNKSYSPSEPSGIEGRYSGHGTNAYYFADSPAACWREKTYYDPSADFSDYQVWTARISGTFVDVGAVEGTRYVIPKERGGWEPTQELSRRLCDESILGFRYASRTASEQGTCGTCFCIYQRNMNLESSDFTASDWSPGN